MTALSAGPRPRSRRRWLRRSGLVVALAGAFLLVFGCTSTIIPPVAPHDPVEIGVLADAMHRGVLLPSADGGLVEYGFGNWNWYALGHDSWYHAFTTVLWPTPGCLARREHPEASPAALEPRMSWARILKFPAPRAKVLELRARLEREFADRAGASHWNPRYGMLFVPCERSYWFASNCSDQAADWLRELGCEVSWVPVRLDFRLR